MLTSRSPRSLQGASLNCWAKNLANPGSLQWIGCPATRSAPQLVREDANGRRNVDPALRRACCPVLPIHAGGRGCGVCQPVQRDVVEHLVLREHVFRIAIAVGPSLKLLIDLCRLT